VSFVYRDGGLVVNTRTPSNHFEEKGTPVPVWFVDGSGLLTPRDISPAFCPRFALRPVRWCPPDQKDSTGRRKPGARAVHRGARHRDVLGLTDEGPTTGSCWGSHHPGPAVAVGDPPARNDSYGHTAWAWRSAMRPESHHSCGFVGAFAKARQSTRTRSVSRYDKRLSMYPTAHTTPNELQGVKAY